MLDYVLRFLIGGLVVSIFAVIGDVIRPKSFAGLFGAAPTIALATLGLTFAKQGAQYVTTEGRSMLLGAVAMFAYAQFTALLLMRKQWSSLPLSIGAYVIWLAVALGLWSVILR